MGAAHVHLPDHLREADEAGWRIAAVRDRDADRARHVAEKTGAKVLERGDDPASSGASAVFVCSETAHHRDDVTAAIGAGLPVFCEKPLAGSAEDARALANLADARGVILETGFFMRSYPALQRLRDTIQSGDLGAAVHVRAMFSHDGGYADWLDVTGWMTDAQLARYGGFADEGVHVLDWLFWTFGPARSGTAALGHALGYGVDDHGAAVLTLANGATAVIEAGWTDTEMRLELDIACENGGARLSDGALRVWTRDGPLWDQQMEDLDAGRGSAAFLARLERADSPPLVPVRDAARTSAALDALYGRADWPAA
jgi:predicted dehydrogenase